MRAPTPRSTPRIVQHAVLAVACAFALAASGTHVVRSGETLADIAADHGTSVRALVESNRIEDPNLILVGQELTIPGATSGSGGGTPAEPATTTHVVARGDTLGGIAARYGTTVRAIAEANGITDPDRIVIGARLSVAGAPAGGSSGTPPAAAPAPSGGSPQRVGQRHTVQIGETIAGIARRYGITSAELIAWNGLVDGRIYATSRLMLWNPGSLPGASSSGPATHVVAVGETLSGIAARFGTSAGAIVSATGLADPDRIVVGQRLTIPGGSGDAPRCPVPGGSFFNDWAFPRSGGRSHAGNDVFAPRGTPVLAPVSGQVDVATGSIGGKQFRLTAADGSRWYGSHLDEFGARGQVSAGDVIGYVGDSGNARGSRPHLHFEVHVGGNAVNPYPLLRAAC